MRKLIWLVATACGASGALRPKDPRTARAQVAALAAAEEAALNHSDFGAMASYLTRDATWIGPRAEQAFAGRDAVKLALEKQLAGKRIETSTSGPRIGVAADGRSAWWAEDLKVKIGDDELPLRVTSFAVDDGSSWRIAAQELSMGVANEEAFDRASRGELPAPASLAGTPAAPAIDGLLDAWRQGMADPASWARSFEERDDAFLYGSAPGEALSGGDTIQKMLADQSKQYKLQLAPLGGLRAGVAPTGAAGYVAGNVAFTLDPGDGKPVTQTYRVMLVYLHDGGAWRPVLAHFSNGL